MFHRKIKTNLSLLLIAFLAFFSLLKAENQALKLATKDNKETKASKVETAKPARDPVAQLRGKLLYRKNQARKLEKQALMNDPGLNEKVAALQAEIETLFIAAEPKLKENYALQKEINQEIENLSKKEQ